MSHTAEWLLSADAAALRAQRHESYFVAHGVPATHVVWVETRPGVMVELDAESEDHASLLADSWLRHCNALSASIRNVKRGKLSRKCVAVIGSHEID